MGLFPAGKMTSDLLPVLNWPNSRIAQWVSISKMQDRPLVSRTKKGKRGESRTRKKPKKATSDGLSLPGKENAPRKGESNMKDRLSARINSLFAKEKWLAARTLLEKELPSTPDSHWLLDRLSVTYYEQRKYARALKLVEQAFKIAPECPLVLWDYAGTLDAMGKTKDALNMYVRIIVAYPELGHGQCGEGDDWAFSLFRDCVFRVGICFRKLGNTDVAIYVLQDFVRQMELFPEVPSLYSVAMARKELLALEGHGKRAFLSEARQTQNYLAGLVKTTA